MNGEKIVANLTADCTQTYNNIRGVIIYAQQQVATAVNSAMVLAYWNIGQQIYEACGKNDRAAYGKQILQYLSEKLTAEFGKGFDIRNLQMMRKFYLTFPNTNALRSQLSWTHYRALMKIKDEAARSPAAYAFPLFLRNSQS